MKVPLISIITVSYNAEAVIEPTLQSVAEQNFSDYEHLIIDGGSTDGTLGIAGLYARPQLTVHSQADDGIYDGMNRGLAMARGKYVIFLNAGDKFASPSTLSRYGEAAEGNADIIYGDTVIVNAEGSVVGPRHLSAPEILTYQSYLKGMLVCHQAFMVKRDLAPKYNLEYSLSADYDWCLGCIANSGVTRRRNLRAVTIHYLEGGMSQKKKIASLLERFTIMRRRFGFLQTVKAHVRFVPRALRRRLKR